MSDDPLHGRAAGKRELRFKDAKQCVEFIAKEQVELVDCVFADPLGLWHHCTFTPDQVDVKALNEGLPFDGSSIRLFKAIQESDMLMKPDVTWCWLDPFQKAKTLHLHCTIYEPDHGQPFSRCPRATAIRAMEYLRKSGIADTVVFGPEAEFFVFDSVKYESDTNKSSYEVDGSEGYWNTGGGGGTGHRMPTKNWYFPVAPIDTQADMRSEMLLTMQDLGVPAEKHHHEVATCQGELGFSCRPLLDCADCLQTYKYVIKNVAANHGKCATFMPKPLVGDNGTGMHVHQSLWKAGEPLFYDKDGLFGLSGLALNYIGGILHHADALTAITCPTVNSYRRLVPGFEAPTILSMSDGNRSAACRIPMYHPHVPKLKRVEVRFPDALCNPYLAFSAMLMAGLDGIENKIAPPKEVSGEDLFEPGVKERLGLKETPRVLWDALDALERDHDFLVKGGVFTRDFIKAYIQHKREECQAIDLAPHPLDFAHYFAA